MYFEDEEEKRRQQTAQYVNTPYGLARNPALGQEKTADVNNSLMINNQQKDEIAERQKQYNSQYNNANEFATGVKNFNVDDWKDIVRKFGLGVEKGADAYSLGAYSQLNKILGGSYEKQNQQYHKMAQEAGVGKWAEKNDLLLDTTASARGPGTWVAKNFAGPVAKASSYIAGDIVNSGITNAARSGNILNQEKFAQGGMKSASLSLWEYLKQLGL